MTEVVVAMRMVDHDNKSVAFMETGDVADLTKYSAPSHQADDRFFRLNSKFVDSAFCEAVEGETRFDKLNNFSEKTDRGQEEVLSQVGNMLAGGLTNLLHKSSLNNISDNKGGQIEGVDFKETVLKNVDGIVESAVENLKESLDRETAKFSSKGAVLGAT